MPTPDQYAPEKPERLHGKRHEFLRQAGRHRMRRNANAIRVRVKVIERRCTGAIAGKNKWIMP